MNGNNQLTRRGGRKNASKNNNQFNTNLYTQSNKYANYNLFRRNEKFMEYYQPGRFAPDRLRVKLVYQDPTGTRTTSGSSQSINWRYRNSAYDPDPSLLTGSIPGYAELSNLYSFYRVHGIHANIQVANQDTQAYVVVCWPSNNDNNVNSLALAELAEYSGNVLATSKIVGGASGMNVCTLTTSAIGQQLVGPVFKTDLDYSSSTSTNPVASYYLNVGAYSPVGNMAYPLVTKIRLIYDIEFFRLRQLES